MSRSEFTSLGIIYMCNPIQEFWMISQSDFRSELDYTLHVHQAWLDTLGAVLIFGVLFIPHLCASITLTLAGDSYSSLSQSLTWGVWESCGLRDHIPCTADLLIPTVSSAQGDGDRLAH